MKKSIALLLPLLIMLIITSCKDSPKKNTADNGDDASGRSGYNVDYDAAVEHAEELCDCLQEAGLDDSFNAARMADYEYMNEIEQKMETEVPECALEILKQIEKEFEELNKREKASYMKSFMHGSIDTECTDVLLNAIPFDMLGMMIKEMERQVERSKNRYDEMELWEEETMEEYPDEYEEYMEALEGLEGLEGY